MFQAACIRGAAFLLLPLLGSASLRAQVRSFPYVERFDSIMPPALPFDWKSSGNRSPSGDFVSTTSSPHSAPNDLLSTNSSIPQFLISPRMSFTNWMPQAIQFWTSRSTTHTSGLLVEASLDDGATFAVALGDTLRNPGTSGYVLFSLQLPALLANQPNVRFRWRLTGGTGGASGSLRIDDVAVSALPSVDISIIRASIFPPLPTSRDSVRFDLTVKNSGLQPTGAFILDLGEDLNQNGVPDAGEELWSNVGPSLSPGDSMTASFQSPPLRTGRHSFIAQAVSSLDQNPLNDTLSFSVEVGLPVHSVVVNEIMYAPAGSEPEWFELVNASADSVNIAGWRVSDKNVSTKTSITNTLMPIPPGGFVVVAHDAGFFPIHTGVMVPVLVAPFSPLNNTTPDAVVLYDERSATMDSVMYSPGWGGQNGTSLERIDQRASSTDPANWSSSVDSSGSTPGLVNSIARLDYDLALTTISISTRTVGIGTVPVISSTVQNVGRNAVETYHTVITYTPRDGIAVAPSDTVAILPHPSPLAPGDSSKTDFIWSFAPAGETLIHVSIKGSHDDRPRNDTLSAH
ncbi:MAG TPA: lamin tail domain-containing protein, partial [Bacteroidota bacterium]|nr:lamin tail domain-containing protein [Bacteroidota bacterium]